MPRLSFRRALVSLGLLACLATPAVAQESHDAPAVQAYVEAMDRMHAAMAAMAYSGDADTDFARGMIPHHIAAIEMAEIALEHGADPEIRTLALAIIEAQQREIAELEAWLGANDPAAGDPAIGHGNGHGHD